MGLFDKLIGKRETAPKPPPPKREPPKIISGSADSPHVAVEMGNAVMMMDREQYGYLYGESNLPDPSQGDLDGLLPKVTRVRALACGMYRGRPMTSEAILDTEDAQALSAFRKTLRIIQDRATFSRCGCPGGPTFELYGGQELIATIGLQHGHAIRWNRWKHDAQLSNGQALNDWLTKHGVERELLDLIFQNQYDAGGMMPLGFRRSGTAPLSRAEQRIRLADLRRVRGGDLEKALQECQQELDAGPDLALGYAVRAFIHGQRGDHSRCIADCTEAIRLGLREAEIFFARAVARDGLGQTQEALADCTTALEIEPNHFNAYNSRGFIRGRLGMLNEALADFGDAIRLAPEWFVPFMNRAQAHLARQDWDAAIADCDQVIRLLERPGSQVAHQLIAAAYANRGQVYRLKGDEARAAADFQEADRLAKNLPKPRQAATCSYCKGTGKCKCQGKGAAGSDSCIICNGSGKCPLCKGGGGASE